MFYINTILTNSEVEHFERRSLEKISNSREDGYKILAQGVDPSFAASLCNVEHTSVKDVQIYMEHVPVKGTQELVRQSMLITDSTKRDICLAYFSDCRVQSNMRTHFKWVTQDVDSNRLVRHKALLFLELIWDIPWKIKDRILTSGNKGLGGLLSCIDHVETDRLEKFLGAHIRAKYAVRSIFDFELDTLRVYSELAKWHPGRPLVVEFGTGEGIDRFMYDSPNQLFHDYSVQCVLAYGKEYDDTDDRKYHSRLTLTLAQVLLQALNYYTYGSPTAIPEDFNRNDGSLVIRSRLVALSHEFKTETA